MNKLFLVSAFLVAGILASCSGGGLSATDQQSAGVFKVESTNVFEGDVWALNRPIVITFNHPVDPTSIGFGSIQIKPDPSNPIVKGRPVTGTFEVVAGTGGKSVVFRPACPTNQANDNGAFVPGGHSYELTLPTQATFGASVLRDMSGHPLSVGLSRTFRTPQPPTETLFIDTVPGPPLLLNVIYPQGMNLYSDPDPTVEIQFNQAVDGRTTNLNTTNVFVLYSDDEIGTPGGSTFTDTNRVPGQLFLIENCSVGGATVFFQVTGPLPPNRRIKVVVRDTFQDIAGETNTQRQEFATHDVPTLTEFYFGSPLGGDPFWNEDDVTVDEFTDHFDNQVNIDPDAGLLLPAANVENGLATASFEYPGIFVSSDTDFILENNTFLEVDTTTQTVITDSRNRSFTVVAGVLNVDDFTIEAGSTLRARGLNGLVVYATGTVTINGTLNVSGNNSNWPTGLNSPQFPEGGAKGECGGGDGGDASQITDAHTPRGESGDGPFGATHGGGEGGEGGYQQSNSIGGTSNNGRWLMAGGAGGGTFAKTANIAIRWNDWLSPSQNPTNFDQRGPDHNATRHSAYDPTVGDPRDPIVGGEPGIRGTSEQSNQTNVNMPRGMFGMEDGGQDDDVVDQWPNYDPAWTGGAEPPFNLGHPTKGPDRGSPGPSVFSNDNDTGDDFWGSRINTDGTVTVGELLIPWAGSGGGGGGDSQTVLRRDLDFDGTLEDINQFWPDPSFPNGTTNRYRKGAAGGGGAGQAVVMSIGPIIIGANARLLAVGGIGHGGESIIFTYNQVSGSGGGSGGHFVFNSATGMDLSAFDLPGLADQAAVSNYLQNTVQNNKKMVRAFGGRRGWCMSQFTNVQGGGGGGKDGNPTFGIGRGGAGGNGVIQFHVPNPATDITWDADSQNGIIDYIFNGDPLNNPMDRDRVEDVLEIVAAPRPYSLIPFFASGSQFQSQFIDTGLAGLRNPPNGTGPFPDWAHNTLQFGGISNKGLVQSTGGQVNPQPEVMNASTVSANVTISSFEVVIRSAQASFFTTAGTMQFLRNPKLLIGYDVHPDSSSTTGFQIVDAVYNRTADTLTLSTRTTDGPLTFALNGANPVWSIRSKYFRVATTGQKDRLPDSASVKFEFQGTVADANGQPDLTQIMPGATTWTTDLSTLKGQRFLRYRCTFDIDAQQTGVSLASERPSLDYVKLPYGW